jgi:hypothetical protein
MREERGIAMTNTTKVPFLDLVTPHQELEAELLAVAKKVFSTAGFIGGPMVEEFERDFARFCEKGADEQSSIVVIPAQAIAPECEPEAQKPGE